MNYSKDMISKDLIFVSPHVREDQGYLSYSVEVINEVFGTPHVQARSRSKVGGFEIGRFVVHCRVVKP